MHAPEIGRGGHVHYLELDQFVGEDFLVTVYGSLNPKVPLEAALCETNAVAARMDRGLMHPTSPFGSGTRSFPQWRTGGPGIGDDRRHRP